MPVRFSRIASGSADPLVDARDTLINRGVSFTHVISEIYS